MRVGDVLRLRSVEGSEIVAGNEFTERLVTGVNVMEVPDIINWVKKGELLITSGYSYKDDPASFAEVIPKLAAKGVAAIGIKRKRYFEKIPRVVIDAAKKSRMVLIELDEKVVFSSVVKEMMTEIVSSEYHALTILQDRVNQLSEMLVQGDGIAKFLEQLSDLLGNPIVLIKENEEHLLFGIKEEELQKVGLSTRLSDYMADGRQGFFTMDADETRYRIYAYAIMHKNEQLAELLVLEVNKEITNEDMFLLHQITYMIGLELISETIRTRTEMRYVEQVIQDWIMGKMESSSNLRIRAEVCGIKIDDSRHYRVLLFHMETQSNQEVRYMINRFQKNLRMTEDIYLTPLDDTIAAVVSEENYQNCIERILEEGSYILGKNRLSICIGGESSKNYDLSESYKEAVQIYRICDKRGKYQELNYFDDIGIYALLYEIPVDKKMDKFLNRYLTPLIQYDKEHESNLFETLKTYIGCQGNKKLTAEKMFTHYNTISYRLERIHQILNMDIEDGKVRFEIQLAILLYEMYL